MVSLNFSCRGAGFRKKYKKGHFLPYKSVKESDKVKVEESYSKVIKGKGEPQMLPPKVSD